MYSTKLKLNVFGTKLSFAFHVGYGSDILLEKNGKLYGNIKKTRTSSSYQQIKGMIQLK